jgi:hypothetical protein
LYPSRLSDVCFGEEDTMSAKTWATLSVPVDLPVSRLVVAGVGFMPVTLIATTAFGVSDLRWLAVHVLVPALVVASVVVRRDRSIAADVWGALVAGVVATAFYDTYRFAFLALGLVPTDPIPHIGRALGLEPAWTFGYLWRYVGNGGGLAVAFVLLGFRGVRAGVAYGLCVCGGLLVTLVASPHGQEMLFPLTGATIVMAVGGHIIYGAVLGWLRGSPRSIAASSGRSGITRLPHQCGDVAAACHGHGSEANSAAASSVAPLARRRIALE